MKKILNPFPLLFLSFVFVFFLKLNGQENNFTETGYASFYADKFEGRLTASGEKYYHEKSTAAHKTLKFGTIVKVTNLSNNKTTAVRINDRGPHVKGRIIDLSKSAAEKLDFINKGLTRVKIEVIDNPFDPGSDSPSADGIYKINIKQVEGKGFGIQLASYGKLSNLAVKLEELPASIKQALHIQVKNKGEHEIYRLISGFYKDKKEVEEQKKILENFFPDCFVINF